MRLATWVPRLIESDNTEYGRERMCQLTVVSFGSRNKCFVLRGGQLWETWHRCLVEQGLC